MDHYCGLSSFVGELTNQYLVESLNLLQHRGHDGAGVSYVINNSSKSGKIVTHKGSGFVKDVFQEDIPKTTMGIGHVRYSTRNKVDNEEALLQPFQETCQLGDFALAHNGNIPNINKFRDMHQIDLESESDTEILTHIVKKLAGTYKSWEDIMIYIVNTIPGVYCITVLTQNKIFCIKDRYGVRPLCIGKKRDNYCVVSESLALQDFENVREVNPGEVISVSTKGVESLYTKHESPAFCSFEYIYFFRHNSKHMGKYIYDLRYQTGYKMGKEEGKTKGDMVICVPKTAIAGARGFAEALRIPFFDEYLIKKPKVKINRTFILPTNKERIEACQKKFEYNFKRMKGKRVYLVDDSIVRGNTMRTIIKNLRDGGIKEVHVAILSPPIVSECYYGIDMSTKDELIASNKETDEIAKELDVNSLRYLSIDTMKAVFNIPVCTSCFDGKYDQDLLSW